MSHNGFDKRIMLRLVIYSIDTIGLRGHRPSNVIAFPKLSNRGGMTCRDSDIQYRKWTQAASRARCTTTRWSPGELGMDVPADA
jgi:hypothetical protein